HLVRHRGGGAGAEEAVEDEVAWVGGDLQDTLDQPLRLWCREWNISWKQRHNFRFCLTIRADFIMWPECYRNQTRLNFRQDLLHTWLVASICTEPNAIVGNHFGKPFLCVKPATSGWRIDSSARRCGDCEKLSLSPTFLCLRMGRERSPD